MIWYICLAAAVCLLVLSADFGFNKRFGRLRSLYMLAGCLVASYLLYIPPLFAFYEPTVAIFGGFVNVFRIISLDADYFALQEIIKQSLSSEIIGQLYYFILAVMHVVLPAASAFTAVTLIAEYMTEIQIKALKKKKRPLHIFSALTSESVLLAKDIRANTKRCDILFLDGKEDTDHSELKQSLRCSVLRESIQNIKAKAKNRQVYYYCISEDCEKNLNDSLAILSHYQGLCPQSRKNTYIYLFTTSPFAEMLIDSADKGQVNLKIVDKHRTAVYDLFNKYPLVSYAGDDTIHLLVSGFGAVGAAVVRAASWLGQLYGYTLKITVLGKNIENAKADFMQEYPNLFCDRYNINIFSYENLAEFTSLVRLHAHDAGYVCVCENDSDTATKLSVALRRLFYKEDKLYKNAPAIFTYIENEEMAAAVASLKTAEAKAERRVGYDIIPFGVSSSVFSYENITDSDIERLSKNVHLVYEDIFSDTEIDVNAALERYNLFEVNKSSNRANAMHIRYKLLMLGLDYTDDTSAEEVELGDYLTDELLEKLTRAEHNRWMAFLDSEGWEGATVRQSLAYQASGISRGRHNCPLLKLHPYICPFEDLKDCSDALGLPDSTVYDRDLIKRIPEILCDRWGVSGKKYKIVRRK